MRSFLGGICNMLKKKGISLPEQVVEFPRLALTLI